MTNNYFRFTATVLSLLVVIGCGIGTAHTQERNYTIPSGGDFHPPRSAAEKTLDRIVKRNVDDSEMTDYLLSYPHRNIKNDAHYAGLFTPSLRDAVSAAEAKEVQEKCGGVYTGDLCGLNFNPIICAQDITDYSLYRVEQQSKEKEVITLIFSMSMNDNSPPPTATYSMIRQGKHWVMDGILCQNWSGYNFSDFDAIKGLTSKLREQ